VAFAGKKLSFFLILLTHAAERLKSDRLTCFSSIVPNSCTLMRWLAELNDFM